MPGLEVGNYPAELAAGLEIASTYEGRHVTVREDELIHPFIADGFVNKGDQVVFCLTNAQATYRYGVGVAFNDGAAAADLIAIDTEGIWMLQVNAFDDNGNSAIEIGEPLYIRAGGLAGTTPLTGLGDAEISKRRNLVTQIPFGYALGRMDGGSEGTICVKVHWDPRQPQDELARFEDGHAADNAMSITVIDTSALAAGNHRAFHINYGNTVNMVGGIRGLGVDVVSTGNAASMNAISVYTGGLGTANIPEISGLNVYMDDIGAGATCAQKFCINLNNDNGDNATIGGFIRVYSHAAGLDNVIYLGNNGANMITHLLQFSAGVAPYDANAHGDTDAGRISVLVAGGQRYLYLYSN